MNSLMRHSIIILLLLAAPMSLQAGGNAAAGQEKAKVCEACHARG